MMSANFTNCYEKAPDSAIEMSMPAVHPQPLNLQTWAQAQGWSVAAACGPDLSAQTADRFRHWLDESLGADLSMQYLRRRRDERLDPRKYLSSVQSVLCFGLYYFPGNAEGELKVSNYSWSPDYHERLRTQLELTVVELKKQFPQFEFKICVDTAPILEKVFAQNAGLGWQGKNTLLLNPHFGSYLFLAEILTSLPLTYFQPAPIITDHCGTCTRCIDACPTQALTPYHLEPSRCISYWNLEHRGEWSDKTPESFYGWLAGCDICQQVCPWNSKLIPLTDSPVIDAIPSSEVGTERWFERIKDSALTYLPRDKWIKNQQRAQQPGNGALPEAEVLRT